MTRLIAEVTTANGGTVYKRETDDGYIHYQKDDGTFLQKEAGERLFTQATRNEEESQLSIEQYEVSRDDILAQRYPAYNRTKDYGQYVSRTEKQYPAKIKGNEQRILSFMSHSEIKKQARNEDFVESRRQELQVREAISRELVEKIQQASSQKEVSRILQQYINSG